MLKKKRIFTVIVTILVILALLSSALFIAVQADHHCSGGHCSICVQLHICQSVLHLSALLVSALASLALSSSLCLRRDQHLRAAPTLLTLVTCKVKLSN